MNCGFPSGYRAGTSSLSGAPKAADVARGVAKAIDQQIAELGAAIRAVIDGDPELSRRDWILRSVPGIGPITAAVLLAEVSELGRLGPKQAASLAGLAPFARESGKHAGTRRIAGGREMPRRVLYMAATTAIRHNPDIEHLHRQLVERGKAHKVALVAVKRRLVVLANLLVGKDREWAVDAPRRTVRLRRWPVDEMDVAKGEKAENSLLKG